LRSNRVLAQCSGRAAFPNREKMCMPPYTLWK